MQALVMNNKNIFMSKFSLCFIILWFLSETIYPAVRNTDKIPLPEHPKPQFKREKWINLNGKWDFCIDYGESGKERGFYRDVSQYDKAIMVPFCPESELSGIGQKDFMPVIWYHRSFSVPSDWHQSRIFLCFGGVDYLCEVWVNGRKVGIHSGGSTCFEFEISGYLKAGENDLFVRAEDKIRTGNQPSGKQSQDYYYRHTRSTRVTGIWQTVWLEARPESYIESVRVIPDLDHDRFIIFPEIQNIRGTKLIISLLSEKGETCAEGESFSNGQVVILDVKNPEAWSPDNPYLYSLKYKLVKEGAIIDKVESYTALRKVHIEGNTYYLNNKPVFLRFALIQGFYPGGVWTPPDDLMLKEDIERAIETGFNGARLHEKVFEDRFLFWADKLGFLVWAEFPDKGCRFTYQNIEGFHNLKREWAAAITQQWNHPCIIGWTPLNEAVNMYDQGFKNDPESYTRAVEELFDLTRLLDPTRPVNDASGYVHVKTDIVTVHNYETNPVTFAGSVGKEVFSDPSKVFYTVFTKIEDLASKGIITSYRGDKPYIIDEYGGIEWLTGLGNNKLSKEEVILLIRDLTSVITENPHIAGFCYTQLYDVMQEVNGVFTYDRKPKFSSAELRKIFGAPAAYIETRKSK